MIHEVRTYDVRPHSVPEVERRLEKACEEAIRRSDLVASFHTEIGPLNQVIQIWSYGDVAERERVRAGTSEAGAVIGEFVVQERTDDIVPFAISPDIKPGTVGPFFEVRTYRYADGDVPKIVRAWEAALPARLALGPLVLVGSSESGGVNTLLHIWPYRTLDERWELRRTLREAGVWPPLVVARRQGLPEYELLHMENKIVVPAAFSPLR